VSSTSESEQAFGRFSEALTPIVEDMGLGGQPEIYPVHTHVMA
jgi:hypothetical protein